MYSLLRSLTDRYMATQQLLSFVASFAIAEFFYKWHSFMLETVGFLATWFVLDLALSPLVRVWRGGRAMSEAAPPH